MPCREWVGGAMAKCWSCRIFHVWLQIAALLLSNGACAEQWYVEPKASLYGFYEDNVRLRAQDPIASPGFILQGDVKAGQRTEYTDIGLNSTIVRRQYFDASQLNTTNFFFDGLGSYNAERDQFKLNARVDLDSTLTSEESTTGRVDINKRRTRWYLAPSWKRSVTELLSLDLTASYQDVTYDEGEAAGLVDYSYATAGLGADYGLSERTRLLGRVTYAAYDAKQTVNESVTLGLLAGLSHSFSESWSMSAMLGLRRAQIDVLAASGVEEESSTGNLADISIEKRFEVGSLVLAFSRSLDPSSSGQLLDTRRISLNWNQPITAQWDWNLTISAYQNEQPSGQKNTDERTYWSIAPRITHKIDREWNIVAGYRYRYQEYDNIPGSAEANAVFFTLTYVPMVER
jgi:hypothetical protein